MQLGSRSQKCCRPIWISQMPQSTLQTCYSWHCFEIRSRQSEWCLRGCQLDTWLGLKALWRNSHTREALCTLTVLQHLWLPQTERLGLRSVSLRENSHSTLSHWSCVLVLGSSHLCQSLWYGTEYWLAAGRLGCRQWVSPCYDRCWSWRLDSLGQFRSMWTLSWLLSQCLYLPLLASVRKILRYSDLASIS